QTTFDGSTPSDAGEHGASLPAPFGEQLHEPPEPAHVKPGGRASALASQPSVHVALSDFEFASVDVSAALDESPALDASPPSPPSPSSPSVSGSKPHTAAHDVAASDAAHAERAIASTAAARVDRAAPVTMSPPRRAPRDGS